MFGVLGVLGVVGLIGILSVFGSAFHVVQPLVIPGKLCYHT